MTPEPVRYAFAGSRTTRDTYPIQLLLSGIAWWKKIYREKIEVLVGEVPSGVDFNTHHIAADMGLHPRSFEKPGDIIDLKPKIVWCIGRSRESDALARRAIKAGIPVYLVRQLTVEDFE